MLTFDDFDAWGEAVSGASLRLACNGIETRRWTLGMLDLGGVVLQPDPPQFECRDDECGYTFTP